MAFVIQPTLSKEENKTFLRLFIPLLDFVNQQYSISEHLSEQLRSGNYVLSEIEKVSRVLWENPSVIDDYIEAIDEQFDVESDDRRILEAWKHPIRGQFVVERHLSVGSVFIDNQTKKVYLVKGRTESWSKSLSAFALPKLISTTLIPFRHVIVTDGLFSASSINFGVEYHNLFAQYYAIAKANGKIITSL